MRRIGWLVLAAVTVAGTTGAWAGPAVSREGAAPIWGWRADGTSAFPSENPVIEWGPSTNVIWKTPLPDWSNASPILVGNKIFVCAEKSTLLCLNKTDGAILWQKTNDLREAFTDEEWKVVEKRRAELSDLTQQINRTNRQIQDTNRKIQLSTQDARDKNEAVLRKQYDQRVEAAKKKEAQLRAEYERRLAEATARGQTLPPFKPPDPLPPYQPADYGPLPTPEEVAALKSTVADLQKTAADLQKKVADYQDIAPASVEGTNGWSTPTPTTDGAHVWVLFNSGVLACYDLDGNRTWIVNLGPSPDGYGNAASPVLVGDKIVVNIERVKAVDKSTGKLVWAARETGPKYGTVVSTTLKGESVVLTASGFVLSAVDGKVLFKQRLGDLDYAAPVVAGGVAYYMQGQSQAWKLPESGSDDAPTRLWTARMKGDRYYGSSLVYKGVVYSITQAGVATAVDAAGGQVLWEKTLPIAETVYPSIVGAGDYVFFSSMKGETAVVKAGKTFEQVRVNSLEPFRSTPVFENGRMYLRCHKVMYCIGKKE
jgi:outer membrane protein assembly factor BamB